MLAIACIGIPLALLAPALVAFIACFDPALAQTRTKTSDGVPLDEPIRIRVQNSLFRVPAGYLWTWPRPEMRDRINEWDSLAFDFWMPSRRYPEVSPISYPGFQPKEIGRPSAAADAYVVKVRQLRPVGPNTPGQASPEQGFKNLSSATGLKPLAAGDEEFGLIRLRKTTTANPRACRLYSTLACLASTRRFCSDARRERQNCPTRHATVTLISSRAS